MTLKGDLISRAAAIKVVKAMVHDPDIGDDAATFGCMVWGVLDRLPAVDAEPVRHGCEYCSGKRVEYQQTKSTKLYINTHGKTRALETECNRCPTYARCSLKGIPILAAFPINYCPNCGAKMDGGVVDATD